MSTATINFMGEHWNVDFNYYAGTNRTIHSASEQPNDAEELEIEGLNHDTLTLSYEFLTEFLDDNYDEFYESLLEHIHENGI